MPTFHYQADDREGRRTSGEVAADDREQALLRLAAQGFRSIRLSDVPPAPDASVPAATSAAKTPALSSAETVDLSALFGMLADANLPLDAGLKAAARELPPGRLSRALESIAAALARGLPLNEALASEGRRFPLHLRGLVLAGLHSGRLGMVLEEFVSLERRAALLRRQVAMTLAYPTFLLAMLLGVGVLFSVVVVPGITVIFNDYDMDLPSPSVVLIELSQGGFYVHLAVLLALAALWLTIWLTTDIAEMRSLLKAAPLVGPIARWASLARFTRLLALLIENRLELGESLRLAGAGSRDYELQMACRHAALRVEAGGALRDAIDKSPAFTKSLGPIVDWGQRATALPEALRTASEMFEARVQAQLAFLRMIFPTLTLLLVLWGVLFLVSATMMPMISLIEKLT